MRITTLLIALFFWTAPTAAQIDIAEKSRNRWQQPEKIMDSVGVRPGMTVGDAGAGTGYFTFKLAGRVGPQGLVYANDILPRRLDEIEVHCRREGVANVRTILGTVVDSRFPAASLDMVFLVYVLHDLKQPLPFLKNLAPALKPAGFLVIVDQDPQKTGSHTGHFWQRERVLALAANAGFALQRIETFLARDNIYIFSLPPPGH